MRVEKNVSLTDCLCCYLLRISFFLILLEKPLPMVAPGDVISVVGLLLAGGVTLGIAITVMVLNMRKQCGGAAESDSYVQCSLLSHLASFSLSRSCSGAVSRSSTLPFLFVRRPLATTFLKHLSLCRCIDFQICYPHAPLLLRFLCQQIGRASCRERV